LERDATNADANLAAGRYRCLVKGDWGNGLPMLALPEPDRPAVGVNRMIGAFRQAVFRPVSSRVAPSLPLGMKECVYKRSSRLRFALRTPKKRNLMTCAWGYD
jgi:hypothetical protein